jgi:hypothetical protein
MTLRTSSGARVLRFSGMAAGALLAVCAGGTAEAKAKLHHHRAHAADPAAAKIRELNDHLAALEARLDAESAARQRVEGDVTAARTEAGEARADAGAARAQLQTQIQTLPAMISADVAAQKPKPRPSDDTVISGRVFYDLTSIRQTPTPNAKNGVGFDIKRTYFGVDHKFNDTYSANLTLDSTGYNATTGNVAVFVKKAYIQAKYSDALVIKAGAADMPWIPFVEDIYGYRFVEKTLTDDNSFANSADWGVFASGKFGGNLVGYSLAAVNGGGYKNSTRTKTMDLEGRVNLNLGKVVLAVGGYTGKLGKDVQAASPTTFHTVGRFDALAAYVDPRFRVGVEYFSAQNWKTIASVAPDRSEGYSVFGSFNLMPKVSVFARHDWLTPSQTLHGPEKGDYYNLGVSYEPVKIVDFALVYKHDAVNHAPSGGLADANTTLAPLGGKGAYDEVGLFGQVRF